MSAEKIADNPDPLQLSD